MDIYEFEAEESGNRIDAFLSQMLEDVSRSYLQKLISDGMVTVDGEVSTAKNRKIAKGQKIRIEIPEPGPVNVEPEDIPLDIVYEDDALLVVDKPKGMVVHPAPGSENGTLVNALLWHLGDRLSGINGILRPGIVHRIDKDTGGLLMVAKSDQAHKILAAQLEEHSIERAYKAIVYDNIREDEGRIDLPIGRDPSNRLRMAVTDKNSKRAVTNYKVLERFGRFTFIEARLETGRTHQIRVHMANAKHPLLGDGLYGPGKNKFGIEGQMLYAYKLGFRHPDDGRYMEFERPLPGEFESVLKKLRSSV